MSDMRPEAGESAERAATVRANINYRLPLFVRSGPPAASPALGTLPMMDMMHDA